ncbi:four helix bundle protein [Pontibacter litorisediminis]|uniref:four helix bundle protein n=1 Tax=Pontibacter litorisediminis TaxID=1846260 RepID=UPI0023EA8275|nr:four helix bundle protein [Pontibacter litorisediminis]
MKAENVLLTKSYAFAIRIVNLYKFLYQEKKDVVMSRQVLRSGTSIGANAEEAIGAQSKRDFISKVSIVYKEARETNYWLRLLRDTGFMNQEQATSLLIDCEELLKITGSILKTTKQNTGT